MADLKIQGEVSLDTTKADAGFAKVEQSAGRMSAGIKKSADAASGALDSIGKGSDVTAQKQERSTRSMISSIQRLTAAAEAGEKGTSKYFESLAKQRGADVNALRPYLQQLDAAREKQDAASRSMSKMGDAGDQVRTKLLALGAAFLGAFSVRAFTQAADAVTGLNNQLKLATGSAEAAASAYSSLFEIAQRSRTNFAELGGLFASITRAVDGLGISQGKLLKLTETIGNAIAVGGSSAQASSAALVQLSQGLASGVLRGDELNSIMEQTPRLARAIADGLDVPIGKLREMGKAGELSSEMVISALMSQSAVLTGEVQSSVLTLGQAFTKLQNSATGLVGEIDRVAGSSASMAAEIDAASSSLDDITRAFKGTSSAGQQTAILGDSIATVFETIAVLGANLAYVLTQIGDTLGGLAAKAAAIATLNLEANRAIGRDMAANAKQAREDIDALTSRILNARRLAGIAAGAASLDTRAEDARLLSYGARPSATRPTVPAKPTRTPSPRLAREAKDEFGDLYNRITSKDAGIDPSFYKDLDTLYQGYLQGRVGVDEYREAVEKLVQVQSFAREINKENAQALETEAKFAQIVAEKDRRWAEEIVKREQSAQNMIDQIELETSLIGLNTQEREEAIAMRELERLGVEKGTAAYEEYAAAIKKALADKRQMQETLDFWRELEGTAENVFMDIALNGEAAFKRIGEAIKREVIRMLYEMTVKRWIISLSGGNLGSAGGSLLDYASSAYQAYSMAGTGFAGGGAGAVGGSASAAGSYVGGTMSGANAIGSMYANTTGTGISGLLSTNAAYGTTAGVGGSGMSALSATGWGALIVAAVVAGNNLYNAGYTRAALGDGGVETNRAYNSTFQTDQNIGNSTAYNIGVERVNRQLGDAIGISNKWSDILSGTTRMAALFGRKLSGYGFDVSIEGGETSVAGYQKYKGGLFRSNKTVATEVDSRDAELVQQTVKGVQESTKAMARAMGYSTEAIDAYTGSLKVNFKGAKTAEEQSERMGKAMDDLSISMLNAASGGEMTKAKFEEFMKGITESMEQAGITTAGIADILLAGMTGRLSEADVGAQLSEVIVGGIYDSIASNYAGMIAQAFTSQIIAPIFTALAAGVPISQAISQQAIANVVATAQQAAAALNAIFSSAEFQQAISGINQAIGGVSGAVGSVRAPSFRAPKPVNTAANDAARERERIAREREQLERELLRLQGDTVELRRRELKELAPANRALQERIWALQDVQELEDAWKSLTDSIEDEIKRIRGDVLKGDEGLAYVQAQFATATASARAMDQEAAGLLPGLASQLQGLYEENASSGSDYQFRISSMLASLEETNRITRATAGIDSDASQVEDKALAQKIELLQRSVDVLQATMHENTKAAQLTSTAINKASAGGALRTVSV